MGKGERRRKLNYEKCNCFRRRKILQTRPDKHNVLRSIKNIGGERKREQIYGWKRKKQIEKVGERGGRCLLYKRRDREKPKKENWV